MKNREIYVQEPSQNRLLNEGVAEVAEDYSAPALAVLRYELETFICEGEYRKGFERILHSYLSNLDKPEQKGVWISGFYGSGKSHLAKMLRILWTDYEFPDGATARNLAKLPDTVKADLKEISTAAKRHGCSFAAAGKIGAAAGNSVRLALLGILFKAKGMPEQYAQSRFLLWLRNEGKLQEFKRHLSSAKKDLMHELNNLYVSSPIAKALKAVDPSYRDEKDIRDTLKAQFKQPSDIGDEEMVKTIEMLVQGEGMFPLTLVILDELQQYVGTDQDRAYQLQLVTEACCKHFGGKLLFVGTGQSALSDMPNLQKIMGRFPLSVQLSDTDVETVIRHNILAKKPSAQSQLKAKFDGWSGEIARHLHGTALAHGKRDDNDLVVDYPILPTRRKFWERALRTMDTSGTIAQLRNQLRIADAAVWATADRPLGAIIGGDFVFDQISGSLVSTARLSSDVYNLINRMYEAPERTSRLKARLLKLVFLVNKLPTESGADTKLRATPGALADLLVEDLSQDSAGLRREVPELLKELAKEGTLMSLQGETGLEYRLQTQESKEWHDEYRRQESSLRGNTKSIGIKHSELIKEWFTANRKHFSVRLGQTGDLREPVLFFGEQLPQEHQTTPYLWVRDGWSTSESSALADIRSLGKDGPTVAVYLSDEHQSPLFNALVGREAAAATLHIKGQPATPEGEEARRSIESRCATAEATIREKFGQVLENAKVYLSGGKEVTAGTTLTDVIHSATDMAVTRLYKEFAAADHSGWPKVYERARKQDRDCLKQVGHAGDAAEHPVCWEVFTFIGKETTGNKVRSHFDSAPYGWPRDAIDGALYALLVAEQIRAIDGANSAVSYSAESLERAKVSATRFRREYTPINMNQRMLLRQLYQKAGVQAKNGEEASKAKEYLQQLRREAEAAGGDPPLPPRLPVNLLDEIEGLIGNQQLLRICEEGKATTALRESWQQAANTRSERWPLWELLTRLADHLGGVPTGDTILHEVKAVREDRRLLTHPDPVRPLAEKATGLLRSELNKRSSAYQAAYKELHAQLETEEVWRKLKPGERQAILASCGVVTPKSLDVSGPQQVLECLQQHSLAEMDDRIKTLASRFDMARAEAAKRLEPEVVHLHLPKRLVRSDAEADAWLKEAEKLIKAQLNKGPVSI